MTNFKEKLGEELYNQVKEKVDVDKLILNDNGEWFPKERYDKVNSNNKELEKQLETIQKQIKDFEPLTEANTELKESVKKLNADIETNKVEYGTKIAKMNLGHKIDTALSDAGSKDTVAVKALLNLSTISLDGENLIGFDDQLKNLKENKGYLFGEIKKQGKEPEPGKTTPASKFGGFESKTEYARKDPLGYAKDYPNGY